MKKIISVFQRNYDTDRLIRNEIVPGAEWVLAGEGVATRKYDGSACAIIEGTFYKRYELKRGRIPPPGFIAAQEPDPVTGECPGWLYVTGEPQDKWFREARRFHGHLPDGTYEAIGPHFQSNPEHAPADMLQSHAHAEVLDCPRSFDAIREFLKPLDIEGIVFHHPDGRMAKVKKRDYGLRRKDLEAL